MLNLPETFRPKKRKPTAVYSSHAEFFTPLSSGQGLLIVLLVMAVVLTVIVSVLSRSVTDVAVTSLEEDALRAFSAAEAGIEQALIVGDIGPQTLPNDATFDASVSDFASGVTEFVHPTEIFSGETNTFWFAAHDDSDSLICDSPGGKPCFTGSSMELCWGDEGTAGGQATTPAIEVAIYYDTDQEGVSVQNFNSVRVGRATYDPNVGRRASNNFSADSGACTVAGENFAFSSGSIDFVASPPTGLGVGASCVATEGCLLAATAKLLYNTSTQHSVGVIVSADTLPSQGKEIQSTGTSGESTRKIQVFQTFPELPFILNATLFSPSDLSHQ